MALKSRGDATRSPIQRVSVAPQKGPVMYRIRSTGEGNVFIAVCHSVFRGNAPPPGDSDRYAPYCNAFLCYPNLKKNVSKLLLIY